MLDVLVHILLWNQHLSMTCLSFPCQHFSMFVWKFTLKIETVQIAIFICAKYYCPAFVQWHEVVEKKCYATLIPLLSLQTDGSSSDQ